MIGQMTQRILRVCAAQTQSLFVKNIATFVAILLAVVIPIAYTYLNSVEQLLTDRLAAQIAVVGQRGAAMVDARAVAAITDPRQMASPEFAALQKTLASIQKDYDVDNAVLMRRLPNQRFVYIADGSGNFSIGEAASLHEDFPATYPPAMEAWDTRQIGKTNLFSSQDTKWFQIYLPLTLDGNVTALLLINKFATPVAEDIRHRQIVIAIGVGVAAFVGIVVWAYFTFLLLRPLRRLRKAAVAVSAGQLDIAIAPYNGRDEIYELNQAFTQMVANLKASREEIEEYNLTLEARILERTQEIRNLLDNMDEGIFSISPQGEIQQDWSAATQRMLGPIHPGSNLIPRLASDPARQQTLRSCFELLFNDELKLGWDDVVKTIPSEFQPAPDLSIPEIFGASGDLWLRARFLPIHGTDGERLERIMVILQDITGEKQLRDDAARSRAWQESVIKVLQNRETYEQFTHDAGDLLAQAKARVQGMSRPEAQAVTALMRSMHTVKGTSGVFGLGEAATRAHGVETMLKQIPLSADARLDEATRQAVVSGIEGVQESLADSHRKFQVLLGEDADATFAVPASKLQRVQEHVLKLVAGGRADEARAWLGSLRAIPTPRLLRKYSSLVEIAGAKLGKSAQLVIDDPDGTELKMEDFRRIDPAFLHLVRNALDHGVELPEERERNGKEPVGRITLSVRKEGVGLRFAISDDGRGIDVDRVRDAAVQRGLLTPESAKTAAPEDIVRMIFAPGFSSAGEVTEWSGRGVGLDAVLDSVHAFEGKVRVATKKGSGTRFELYIPLEGPSRLAS